MPIACIYFLLFLFFLLTHQIYIHVGLYCQGDYPDKVYFIFSGTAIVSSKIRLQPNLGARAQPPNTSNILALFLFSSMFSLLFSISNPFLPQHCHRPRGNGYLLRILRTAPGPRTSIQRAEARESVVEQAWIALGRARGRYLSCVCVLWVYGIVFLCFVFCGFMGLWVVFCVVCVCVCVCVLCANVLMFLLGFNESFIRFLIEIGLHNTNVFFNITGITSHHITSHPINPSKSNHIP